jgi:hypothetical protein
LGNNVKEDLIGAYVSLVDKAQALPASRRNKMLIKGYEMEDALKAQPGWHAGFLHASLVASSAATLSMAGALIKSDVLTPNELKMVFKRLNVIAKEEGLVGLSAATYLKRLGQSNRIL